MGRDKPKKPRRSRFRVDGEPVDRAGMWAEAERIANTVDDHGRILFWDDPALSLGAPVTDIDPAGNVVTDTAVDKMPAALFEPARAALMQHPGEPARESQVEGAVLLGLRRIPRGAAQLVSVPGWTLVRLADDRLELRSPDGGVYSRIDVPLAPEWVSAALHHGWVLCLYGPQLGVRTPPGVAPDAYTDEDRLKELREARGRGFVAGGLVAYDNNRPNRPQTPEGPPPRMTFEWTTPPWERIEDCTHMATTLADTGDGKCSVVSEPVRGDTFTEALADYLMGPGGKAGAAMPPGLIGVVVKRGIDVMWLTQPPIHAARGDEEGTWQISVDADQTDVMGFPADDVRDLLTRLRAQYGGK